MDKAIGPMLLSGMLVFTSLSCAGAKSSVNTASRDTSPQRSPPSHPLDAYSAQELERALQILREQGRVNAGSVFSLVAPWEIPKQELASFQAGAPVPRRVFVVVYEPARNETFEAVVRLGSPGAVESWKLVPGVQPPMSKRDDELAEKLTKQDARWQAALRRRGVSNPEHVYFDVWAMGPSMDPQLKSHRLVKILPFFKGDTTFHYARPIEGLVVLVDLTEQKVVEVIDRGDIPIPRDEGAYNGKTVGPMRAPPRPVAVTHPEGVNFTLTGNEVRWQSWRFRVDSYPREGPVLRGVSYADQGRERKVLHRLSLSEIVVPYGDPEDTWSWRSAFDVGEYNIGGIASPLEPGVDVPANAAFLSSPGVSPSGEVREMPRVIAIYERDGGVLWKHHNNALKINESRRGIELVVVFNFAVENYDYMIHYIFKQDGSLDVQAFLTGIMLAKAVHPKPAPAGHAEHDVYGHVVKEGVLAVHHQHFFNFRLDFDVDGPRNSVMEMNSYPVPRGPENPSGNAFTMRMEPLPDEARAQRDVSLAQARRWLVINPEEHNALGGPTGYALVPGENAIPYASPDSLPRKRGGFIDHHFWATRYALKEMYAAGDYPNQSEGGDGLPSWVKDNQSLVNEDVVVWYTLGVTHTPRPEEWPVMPAAHAGFKLLPVGFFSQNPALDMPKAPAPTAESK